MTYITPTGAITYALDPRFVCRLLAGSNRVETAYGVYSPGGKPRVHYGIDIDTPGADWRVRATVSGKVVSSTIVTDHSNATWEWGHYVCILDAEGYRHYFCHLASRAVSAGQSIKAGDILGVMGKTGNAAGDRQAEHVHYEVRKSPYRYGTDAVDPTPWAGIPNRQGWTGEDAEAPEARVAAVDLSHHQGNVDFDKLRAQGVTAVIVRLAYGLTEDSRCRQYVAAARAAGLDVYGYYYSVAHYHTVAGSSLAAGKAYGDMEADFVAGLAEGLGLDFCAYDLELADEGYTTKLDGGQLTELAEYIMGRLSASGLNTALYASASWMFGRMGLCAEAFPFDLWVAYWTDEDSTHQTHAYRFGGFPPGAHGERMAAALALGKLWAWQWGGGKPAGMGAKYGVSSAGIDRDWLYKMTAQKEGESMISIFTASEGSRLEILTEQDVHSTVPDGEGGTARWPAGDYAVYATGSIKGENGMVYEGAQLKREDGSLAWAAKLPGKYSTASKGLYDAEQAGLLGVADYNISAKTLDVVKQVIDSAASMLQDLAGSIGRAAGDLK